MISLSSILRILLVHVLVTMCIVKQENEIIHQSQGELRVKIIDHPRIYQYLNKLLHREGLRSLDWVRAQIMAEGTALTSSGLPIYGPRQFDSLPPQEIRYSWHVRNICQIFIYLQNKDISVPKSVRWGGLSAPTKFARSTTFSWISQQELTMYRPFRRQKSHSYLITLKDGKSV